jgi:hypothetical protein
VFKSIIQWNNQKETIYTISMPLTIQVKKEDKIYKNSPYSISNPVEI